MRTGIATIPLDPKIPLKNYLLDLVAESDGKESSVYLKGVEKFIQEVWEEMVKNNWRTLRVKQFVPEKLGVHQMMLYNYKNGRKAISIQNLYKLVCLWKEYCKKTNKDIQEKWDGIYESDYAFSVHRASTPTKLPKYLSPTLSYLIGFICGDGHLANYGNHYLLKLSEKSLDQLNRLRFLFNPLFNVKIPLFKIYRKGYALQIGNKAIYRFLTQVLNIKVGTIPRFIYNLDDVNKKYFLMGIFDSEGNIDVSYLNSKIAISQAGPKFLEEVINLFQGLGINFTGPHLHKTRLGTWYTIQIRAKSAILKYIKEIGSYHIDKIEKINLLEKEIYAHGYSYITT